MHQINECISIDELEKLTVIYEKILLEYEKIYS